jgi:hypothetical protein
VALTLLLEAGFFDKKYLSGPNTSGKAKKEVVSP